MTPRSEDAPDALPLPATSDVVAAWPQGPQQLFLLLHGADQRPADWLPLAQAIAHHFPQGLVAALATPAALLHGSDGVPTHMPAAVEALHQRVRHWQTHASLGFERTALKWRLNQPKKPVVFRPSPAFFCFNMVAHNEGDSTSATNTERNIADTMVMENWR